MERVLKQVNHENRAILFLVSFYSFQVVLAKIVQIFMGKICKNQTYSFSRIMIKTNPHIHRIRRQSGSVSIYYTRCDDVCLLIAQKLKVVKSQMTEDELSKVQLYQ